MELELAGQHVLISGGSKGIGLACAHAFLAEGARVSLVSRDPANLQAARERLGAADAGLASRILTVAADLQQPEHALRALTEAEAGFGPVDVLVNSAGAARRTVPDELDAAAWQAAMGAKFFSYVHLLTPVVQAMARRGRGVVVNVVGAGGKVPSAFHLPGGAANAALMLVSAGLAAAYGPQGVRVNAVNPAATHTERLQSGLAVAAQLAGISPAEALARAEREVPLGRLARPEEVADAVLFLASPRASYISGVVLTLDGAAKPMVV